MRLPCLFLGLVLLAVACGSGSGPDPEADLVESTTGDGVEGSGAGSGVSEGAMAVLMIDGETFTFEANEWSRCVPGSQEIEPEAYFGDGEEVAYGSEGFDFVYFGISSTADQVFLRARVGGEERSHNAGTDDMTLEMRSDGFSYSDDNGQPVRLDVTC